MTNEQLMYENDRLRQELASRDRDMAKLRERLQKYESEERVEPVEKYWFTGKYTLEELLWCSEHEISCHGCPLYRECYEIITPQNFTPEQLKLHAKKEG
jgi:hypothetical protein